MINIFSFLKRLCIKAHVCSILSGLYVLILFPSFIHSVSFCYIVLLHSSKLFDLVYETVEILFGGLCVWFECLHFLVFFVSSVLIICLPSAFPCSPVLTFSVAIVLLFGFITVVLTLCLLPCIAAILLALIKNLWLGLWDWIDLVWGSVYIHSLSLCSYVFNGLTIWLLLLCTSNLLLSKVFDLDY